MGGVSLEHTLKITPISVVVGFILGQIGQLIAIELHVRVFKDPPVGKEYDSTSGSIGFWISLIIGMFIGFEVTLPYYGYKFRYSH